MRTTVSKALVLKMPGAIMQKNTVYMQLTEKRSRKVTETKDAQGKLIQVQESLYLGQVEYRSTWKGKDLTYDGAVIQEASGQAVAAQLQYKSLRLTEGHRPNCAKRHISVREIHTVLFRQQYR